MLFTFNLHEVTWILKAVYILHDETLFWQPWSRHLTAKFSPMLWEWKASFSKLSSYLGKRNKKYFYWKLAQGSGIFHFPFYLLDSQFFPLVRKLHPLPASNDILAQTHLTTCLQQSRLFLLPLRNILFAAKINISQKFHLQCKDFFLRETLANVFKISRYRNQIIISEIYFMIFS